MSKNKRSVQVKLKNSYLSCSIRNKTDFKGDIFNLVSYIEFDKRGEEVRKNLSQAKKFVCEVFGWSQFLGNDNHGDIIVKDYTASLKEIRNEGKKKVEIKTNPILPDDIMNQFYIRKKPLPWQSWIDEGITYHAQVMYGVGWDWDSKRVVFPLKNRFGQVVGVKGRIMRDEDDEERKYLYLYSCNNRYEWFNMHYAHTYILMEKRVYIYESEKSVMKAYSNGIYNTLAIGSSDITEEQAEILKIMGKDIEIVLCYDKDKSASDVRLQAEKFEGRKIFGMFDTGNLLGEKMSPIDNGIDVWNELVENNIYSINF
jgi:DNA primase